MTFTVNGKYLVSGGHEEAIQVWRVKDGKRVAAMKVQGVVNCVTVSKDGRWIAAGTKAEVSVWDATNYKQVFASKIGGSMWDLDFSPDYESRLLSADGLNNTATIWDLAAREKVQALDHNHGVYAAKYSPQGDRIATATKRSIRVWDSDDGRLLVDVEVQVEAWYGLLWFNNHLFVIAGDSKIRQIDASTGSTVSEWSVPSANARIALPQHGKFIAHSTGDNVTFWDTSTHLQLGFISRSSQKRSIAFSPDNRHFAIVTQQQKISINAFSTVKVRSVFFPYLPTREQHYLCHTQGTRHSYWKCCAQSVERWSTHQGRSVTDCCNPDVRGHNLSCTRQSSSCPGTLATMGCSTH